MSNKNYIKGVALERELVNAFRKAGYQACRSAGSHSSYDVFVWCEVHTTQPKESIPRVLDKLKFGWSAKDIWRFKRVGKKYIDTLSSYDFITLSSTECMWMFQCKRRLK